MSDEIEISEITATVTLRSALVSEIMALQESMWGEPKVFKFGAHRFYGRAREISVGPPIADVCREVTATVIVFAARPPE